MAAQIQTVSFHGQTLSVIPQQDKLYVAIKPICENIGIQWHAQRKRIHRDTVLSEGASIMDSPSKGGDQQTFCLPLELLNGWLFGIDENRIKDPNVKARVIEYKKECYQALFDYWTKGKAINSRNPFEANKHKAALNVDMFSRVARHRWYELDKLTERQRHLIRQQEQLARQQSELIAEQHQLEQQLSAIKTNLYDPLFESGFQLRLITGRAVADNNVVEDFIKRQDSYRR